MFFDVTAERNLAPSWQKLSRAKVCHCLKTGKVGTVRQFLNKICQRHWPTWISLLAQMNLFRNPAQVSLYRGSRESSISQSPASPVNPRRHAKLTVTRW